MRASSLIPVAEVSPGLLTVLLIAAVMVFFVVVGRLTDFVGDSTEAGIQKIVERFSSPKDQGDD